MSKWTMIKSQLDQRICDCIDGADTTQTFREFIVAAEKIIYGDHEDIDIMSDEELDDYLDHLDYLLEK